MANAHTGANRDCSEWPGRDAGPDVNDIGSRSCFSAWTHRLSNFRAEQFV